MRLRPRRTFRSATLTLAAVVGPSLVADPITGQTGPPDHFSFVVAGHVRGNSDAALHPRLDELLDEIARLEPDLLFLTGDMIWGSLPQTLTDRSVVEGQWRRLDAKLSELGIPAYRVPGNHDIHDPITRDVFMERYGKYPRSVVHGNARFFLLNSTYTPKGDEPVPVRLKMGKTLRLDAAQVRFIRDELSAKTYDHEFLLMHHVLWWHEDDPWWEEVHPLLVEHGVRAVLAGDLGPTMYTHLQRDGVEYYRSIVSASVEKPLDVYSESAAAAALIEGLQFENFLHVSVEGDKVQYEVGIIGATTSDAFAPDRWREAFGAGLGPGRYYDPATFVRELTSAVSGSQPERGSPVVAILRRGWELFGTPRRLALLMVVVAMSFASGVLVGKARRSTGESSG